MINELLLHIYRGIAFITFLPLLTVTLFFNAIGGNPKNVNIAIVNEEINSFEKCRHSSIMNILDEDRCELNKISCNFLSELDDDDIISQKPYANFQDAHDDAERGKVMAIINFNRNFSRSLGIRLFDLTYDLDDEILIDESQIKVTMDQSNHLMTNFMKKRLYDAYNRFAMNMSVQCGLSPKLALSPVNFLQPIFGSLDADFKASMAPPLIIVNLFFMASCLISFIFLDDRNSGSWNRVLLSGLTTSEVIASHVIIQTVVLLIQLIQTMAVVLFYFEHLQLEQIIILIAIFVACQYCGLFFGMCVSCISGTIMKTQFALTGLVLMMILITGAYCTFRFFLKFYINFIRFFIGIAWPTEGMVHILRFVTNFTPFTLPSVSIRNVITKSYGFKDLATSIGIGVPLVWTLLSIVGVVIILKKRKFN